MKSLILVVALAIVAGIVAFAPLGGSSPTHATVHITESATLPEQPVDATTPISVPELTLSDGLLPCFIFTPVVWHPAGQAAVVTCVTVYAVLTGYNTYVEPLFPPPRSINPNIKGGWLAPICPLGNGGLACGW